MKLLLCTNCGDIFNLDYHEKTCRCGGAKGKYLDNLNAVYSGDSAIPLGFSNPDINRAIRNQPESGMGEKFIAFIIPKECPTLKKKD